jgi:membrane protein YfhO
VINPANSHNQTQSGKKWNPDWIAIAALVLILIFFYWGFWVGRSFMWNDTLDEFYPGVNYFAKSIHGGRFPLWFPGVRDGLPFYSDPQITVFYPPQWLLVPFVVDGRLPFLVYQRYIVLHYILGGLLMYAFLKQIKLGPLAALTGAVVFCLSGFASLRIVNFVVIQVYVWLPLQLLCIDRLVSGKSRWAWLGLVGAMVMSLLAGHQQTTVYCWYLVIAYWLYRYYCLRHKQLGCWKLSIRQVMGKDLPKLVGTFVLVFGLSASMLVPAVENWLRTSRPRQPFEDVADMSLPYDQLLAQLVPNFFGETRSANSPAAFWGFDPRSPSLLRNWPGSGGTGFWQYWESGAYAGQIFWLALVLILCNWQRIEDKRTVGFFLATWVMTTWFMLGRYGGLFQILYYIVPGVSMFRGPVKMSCVATFAAAVLSAYSMDFLRHRARNLRYWPVLFPSVACAGLVLVLLFGGAHLPAGLHRLDRLNWSRQETTFVFTVGIISACAVLGAVRTHRRSVQQACLCCLLVVTVADFYHAFESFQYGEFNPDEYFPKTDNLLALLKENWQRWGPYRFGQISGNQINEAVATVANLPYFHDFLEVPEGYTSFQLDNVGKFRAITNEEPKIAIQNIKILAVKETPGHYRLVESLHTLPRCVFFTRVRRYESSADLLEALESGKIDWSNEAAVCELPAADISRWNQQNQVTDGNDMVTFTSITPESYSITYRASRPGIIFVSQAFYPGWVTDNERIKLIEVFGAFQGLVIPEAGQGQIVVRFSPPILRRSLAVSVFSLAIILSLVTFGRWGQGLENR